MNKDVAYTRYRGNGAWAKPQRFTASLSNIQEVSASLTVADLERLSAMWEYEREYETLYTSDAPYSDISSAPPRTSVPYLCALPELPPRKLRKCHLRKMERRRQRERRRHD